MTAAIGNRCGHDPKRPRLTPASPIRKGKGAPPRILSLAAERAKAIYFHPKKCPPLQSQPKRQTRSERREAHQIVLETILSLLDLNSMCLGTPTAASGFVDVDMRSIVRNSGIGQRRCERAIADFKKAGFMKVSQPRTQNEEGQYFGCRAIRVVASALFEWLGLGPMLQRERARAAERLRRKAQKLNVRTTDFMKRITQKMRSPFRRLFLSKAEQEKRENDARRWNSACVKYLIADLSAEECKRRTNQELGLPADYSPGGRM